MRRTLALVAVSSALATAFSSRAAHAEDRPGDAALADGHFQRGVAHYDQGDYPAALVDFRKAYETAPDFRVLYNIAQASYRAGQYASARDAFGRYLADGGERVPAPRRQLAERNLIQLEALVGRIRIAVDRPGARVLLDGQSVGVSPLSAPIVVDPGRHEIRAELEGQTAHSGIDVTKGGEALVSLRLTPTPEPASDPVAAGGHRSLVGPALLVSGGVVLVGSLVLDLVIVRSKLEDFETLRDRDDPRAADARRSTRTLQTTTLVGYGVGALVTGVGAVITLWPRSSRGGAATVALVPAGAGVSGLVVF